MELMAILKILVLAIVQGLAELLPVSSSAHVTAAARLIGYDLGSTKGADIQWVFLLIMLHTGTMFSVLIYFWSRWKPLLKQIPALIVATAITGVLGFGLKMLIEHFTHDSIENLSRNLLLIAPALVVAGIMIIIAGRKDAAAPATGEVVGLRSSGLIGAVQGLCLPFRGFSRSGSTISTGMFLGIARVRAEEFSFALAVILTPPLIAYEGLKLVKLKTELAANAPSLTPLFLPGLLGMGFSFVAGLVALRWLSRWLEKGHWSWFGYYCLIAAAAALAIHFALPT